MKQRNLHCLNPGGFHRLAYTEWGDPHATRTVVCVHGLTRNGRDFDSLAERLSARCRVVCPDIVGRGASDWLPAGAQYGYPQYLSDMATLIARLDVEAVDWIGTSMGGLVGMMLAAQPQTPIRRLVMNDVGPLVPKASLERLAAYVGRDPSFTDQDALEAYLRQVHAPFGPLTDAEWRHLATHSTRQRADGSLGLAYDPAIAAIFTGQPLQDVDLWPVWDAVQAPALVVRGAESDMLTGEIAAQMTERGPRAALVTLAGCGHAPTLSHDDQMAPVLSWLGLA